MPGYTTVLTELPLRPPNDDIEDLMPFNFATNTKHLLTLENSALNATIQALPGHHYAPAGGTLFAVYRNSRLRCFRIHTETHAPTLSFKWILRTTLRRPRAVTATDGDRGAPPAPKLPPRLG